MSSIATIKLPISVCHGPTRFGDVMIETYVLDDERCLITQRGVIAALTGLGAKHGDLGRYLDGLPNKPDGFELVQIVFRIPGAPNGHGIDAMQFVQIVKLYAEAFALGLLRTSQRAMGLRCNRIAYSLMGVAVTKIIYEATGYADAKHQQDIDRKIQTYLLPAPTDWERTFPPEFFDLACKIFRVRRNGSKNPRFVQGFIRTFVYDHIDPDVARAVKKRNPHPRFGSNHHQHYAERPKSLLGLHINRLMAVMRQSDNKDDFYMRFTREFKGGGLQLSLGAA